MAQGYYPQIVTLRDGSAFAFSLDGKGGVSIYTFATREDAMRYCSKIGNGERPTIVAYLEPKAGMLDVIEGNTTR